VLGEGRVAIGEWQLRIRVFIPVAVTAEAQVCPRAKYGAIAAREIKSNNLLQSAASSREGRCAG